MTVTVAPARIRLDTAGVPDVPCTITVDGPHVAMREIGDPHPILTALHVRGAVYGVDWEMLPEGWLLSSGERSRLIAVMQAAIAAS